MYISIDVSIDDIDILLKNYLKLCHIPHKLQSNI